MAFANQRFMASNDSMIDGVQRSRPLGPVGASTRCRSWVPGFSGQCSYQLSYRRIGNGVYKAPSVRTPTRNRAWDSSM